MADNNNNNGNNLVNPNNRNSGIDDSSIRMSISEMGMAIGTNISKSVAQVIKAIEALNKDSKNNNNLNESIERLIKALEENSGASKGKSNKPKTVTESLIEGLEDFIDSVTREQARFLKKELKANEELQKISNLQNLIRRGDEKQSKAAKQIWDLKQKEIEAYKENIEKQQQLSNAIEFLNIKADTLKAEKELLQKQAEDKNTSKEDKNLIDSKLREIDKTLQSLADEIEDNNDQLEEIKKDNESGVLAKEFKETSKLIEEVSSNTDNIVKTASKINKEVEKENRRKAKQEKVESARDYRIADKLADCFDGGLFELGDELSKTFKEATQKHLEGTRTGILGNITSFAEKTFFSIMDYQTEKFTEAIGNLQQSFETTGMELSKAILVDRNEIVDEYQDVANRLQEEGYDKSLNVTDILGYETQIAKAGITDTELIHEIAYQFGKISAETGVGLPDLLSDEVLLGLQHSYLASGENIEKVASEMNNLSAGIINAVRATGSATGISQGKIQETTLSYIKNVVETDLDTATDKLYDALAVQTSTGKYLGGTDVYQTIANAIESLKNESVSNNILAQMQGLPTVEQYKEMVKSGQYLEALTGILSDVDNLSNTDSTNTVLNWLGINPEAWNDLTSTQSIDEIIEEIKDTRSAMEQGNESDEVKRRQELVKEGRTSTVEQTYRNRAMSDAAGIWGATIKSGIPESTKMLVSVINNANSGIQSIVSWGFETLFSRLGSGGSDSIVETASDVSDFVEDNLSTSGGMSLTRAANSPTVSKGVAAVAGVAAFMAGWDIGEKIDEYFHLSEKLSNVLVGGVAETQDAIDNLAKIEKNNQIENKENEDLMTKCLQNIELSSNEIKQNLIDNMPELTKDVSNVKNTRENIGATIRSTIERGDEDFYLDTSRVATLSNLIEMDLGKSVDELTDDELADWYLNSDNEILAEIKNEFGGKAGNLEDIHNDALDKYKRSVAELTNKTINIALSNALSDGVIDEDESKTALEDINRIALQYDIDLPENINEDLETRIQMANDNYKGYSAATKLLNYFQQFTDTSIKEGKTASEIKNTILDIKNGRTQVEGITEEDLALASPYMYMDKNSLNGNLAVIDPNLESWALYTPSNVEKFATGLDYVPYDNYLALLHKGERVQTAAEARLDDLADSITYNSVSKSNITNTNNNIDGLDTTNNSIKNGFDTTNNNQETIIEALKTIISALSNSNSALAMPDVFESISNNKVALRSNNIARMASMH